MSVLWILLVALGVGLLMTVLLSAILLYCPVVITVDSRSRQAQVRWLAILEYLQPLPGAEHEAVLRVAGRQVHLRPRKPKSERIKTERRVRMPQRATASLAPFLLRCLADSNIRRGLVLQLRRLWLGCLRSVVLGRRRSSLSLPDPALNGMLAGILGFSGWGRKLGMGVNFTGENSFELEFRLRPYRMVQALLSFFCGLPIKAIFRAWRGASLKAAKRSI